MRRGAQDVCGIESVPRYIQASNKQHPLGRRVRHYISSADACRPAGSSGANLLFEAPTSGGLVGGRDWRVAVHAVRDACSSSRSPPLPASDRDRPFPWGRPGLTDAPASSLPTTVVCRRHWYRRTGFGQTLMPCMPRTLKSVWSSTIPGENTISKTKSGHREWLLLIVR